METNQSSQFIILTSKHRHLWNFRFLGILNHHEIIGVINPNQYKPNLCKTCFIFDPKSAPGWTVKGNNHQIKYYLEEESTKHSMGFTNGFPNIVPSISNSKYFNLISTASINGYWSFSFSKFRLPPLTDIGHSQFQFNFDCLH
jgi:hypothetical protein